MNTEFVKWVAELGCQTDASPFTTQSVVRRAVVTDATNLITPSDLGGILDRPEDYPRTLCVMSGMKFVPQQHFGSRAELEAFASAHAATIAYSAAQRSLVAVKQLCEAVEECADIRAFGSIYQTPSGSQGFRIHWDIGSVAVLQVGGEKDWEVYRPIVSSLEELKGRDPHLTDEEANQEPVLRVRLKPGDALFIPRGAPHFAVAAEDKPSLHLSIGLLHSDIDLASVSVYP